MAVFGIIGYPLGHSFSKKYFEDKFAELGIEQSASFQNFAIEDIKDLSHVLSTPQLEGFCITIPHKKNIIPYLTEASPEVEEMGACNCVRIKDGKLIGHNTDIIGFEKSFVPNLTPERNKALILGTGGASAAVAFVLRKLGIPYQFVSRNSPETWTYNMLDKNVMDEYKIIINCTPLGMSPNIDDAPPIPYEYLTSSHYLYDLIYNPAETKFLSLGKAKGAAIENGLQMLILQAEENWRIWNS
ncbi:MAG: shikimate dehydrogenase [Pseudopedobacter saltans]|uniref:Shikimate dehydrogenase n=1 Tax=Pseudopedobacter saltans TaxID=151895 RepID=A0A2W5F6V5_9SPHI|nr:MAG: shikimate dehydrogenase [Pseudopedobacter saltans]